jgi:lipopolysaccharide transport system permease protein
MGQEIENYMSNHTSAKSENEDWDLEIRPKAKLLDLNLSEVWRYRDLMFLFVKRDFVAQYKQTILGPIWHFIQPILTTIMFLMLFTRVARLPTDGIPPVLFYMSGITIWNYFSVCLTSTTRTFTANANIFGKVYFPRIIMPMSLVISNLIRFCIQFLLVLIAIIYYSFEGYTVHITIYWLAIPFLLFLLSAICLGLGIIVSALTTKYRDFIVLVAFGIQLLMYGTPIAYPLSFMKSRGLDWIIKFNPLTSIVEAFRYALFGKGTFTTGDILYAVGFTFVVLMLGLVLFNKVEKSFMDTV